MIKHKVGLTTHRRLLKYLSKSTDQLFAELANQLRPTAPHEMIGDVLKRLIQWLGEQPASDCHYFGATASRVNCFLTEVQGLLASKQISQYSLEFEPAASVIPPELSELYTHAIAIQVLYIQYISEVTRYRTVRPLLVAAIIAKIGVDKFFSVK